MTDAYPGAADRGMVQSRISTILYPYFMGDKTGQTTQNPYRTGEERAFLTFRGTITVQAESTYPWIRH